jgi:hypothetical protein
MSSRTSSRSTFTMVPATMSPSLKYLIVSSIAARKSSADPMSLIATCGVLLRRGASRLLVIEDGLRWMDRTRACARQAGVRDGRGVPGFRREIDMHERSLLGLRLRRLTAHRQDYGVAARAVNAGVGARTGHGPTIRVKQVRAPETLSGHPRTDPRRRRPISSRAECIASCGGADVDGLDAHRPAVIARSSSRTADRLGACSAGGGRRPARRPGRTPPPPPRRSRSAGCSGP